jgi:hypothetical protein
MISISRFWNVTPRQASQHPAQGGNVKSNTKRRALAAAFCVYLDMDEEKPITAAHVWPDGSPHRSCDGPEPQLPPIRWQNVVNAAACVLLASTAIAGIFQVAIEIFGH